MGEVPSILLCIVRDARDVAMNYIETPAGLLPAHKLEQLSCSTELEWNKDDDGDPRMCYLVEVYVNDFIALVIPTTWHQIRHVTNGVMFGIHDVFLANPVSSRDPISE